MVRYRPLPKRHGNEISSAKERQWVGRENVPEFKRVPQLMAHLEDSETIWHSFKT